MHFLKKICPEHKFSREGCSIQDAEFSGSPLINYTVVNSHIVDDNSSVLDYRTLNMQSLAGLQITSKILSASA